jgi:hypothetical protein
MNTAPTFAKSLTLRGRINVELVPAKAWRELAKKGVKSMSYRISGDAEVNGEILHVNVHVPAINDGRICGLGSAIPANGKEAKEFISSLCPKNGGLDTAVVATDANGVSVIEDGRPVWVDAPIVQDDGAEFDLAFGTHYFAPHNGGLTIKVNDAAIQPSDRAAADGTAYYDVRGLSHEVVAAQVARATGAPLTLFTGAKQAARKTTASTASAAPVDAALQM